MQQVDEELRRDGISIPARPIKAILKVSAKYGLRLRLFPLPDAPPSPGSYYGDDLAIRINNWFVERYGKKLSPDWSPGHTIINIRGDLYRLILPRFYGKAIIVADPQAHGKDIYPNLSMGNQLLKINILEYVDDLEPEFSKALKPEELHHLILIANSQITRFSVIESLKDSELGGIAQANLRSAVDYALASPPQYGPSRWESLQGVEKIMKVYLDEMGFSYPRTHDARKLAGIGSLERTAGLSEHLLAAVYCNASVRYEDRSTSNEAVYAHYVACEICFKVIKAMMRADGYRGTKGSSPRAS